MYIFCHCGFGIGDVLQDYFKCSSYNSNLVVPMDSHILKFLTPLIQPKYNLYNITIYKYRVVVFWSNGISRLKKKCFCIKTAFLSIKTLVHTECYFALNP